jgi:formate-dependent nitrite reductase membrane component NrfD
MPVLFMASAMSTGLAVAMIGAAVIDISTIRTLSNFALGHVIFLVVEGMVLMLFIFMSLTRSTEAATSAMMLIAGVLSPYFWSLVVVLGILVPLVLSVVEYYEYGRMPKHLVVAADLLVLVGGMSLRALIIFSGSPPQII